MTSPDNALNGYRKIPLTASWQGRPAYFCIGDNQYEAEIESVNTQSYVIYAAETKLISRLISIRQPGGGPPMGTGDSGTIVFDGNNMVIGMLISSDGAYSYLCRLDMLFTIYKLNPNPNETIAHPLIA